MPSGPFWTREVERSVRLSSSVYFSQQDVCRYRSGIERLGVPADEIVMVPPNTIWTVDLASGALLDATPVPCRGSLRLQRV